MPLVEKWWCEHNWRWPNYTLEADGLRTSLTCNRSLPSFMDYELTSCKSVGYLVQHKYSSESNIVSRAFPPLSCGKALGTRLY